MPYGVRRRLPPPTVGRPHNWILEQILNYATRAHIPDAELTRTLAEVDFP